MSLGSNLQLFLHLQVLCTSALLQTWHNVSLPGLEYVPWGEHLAALKLKAGAQQRARQGDQQGAQLKA